jgi:hypothetical protein
MATLTPQVVLVSSILAPLGVLPIAPGLLVGRDAVGIVNALASLLVSTYFTTKVAVGIDS